MARNVFLSFVAEDLQLVNLFRGQAKRANSELEFTDHSVKEPFESNNAEYIKREIRDQINRVSVTVCLIGRTTYASKWVDWELRTSTELGKGLVGVRLHSDYLDIPPSALKENKGDVVDWSNPNDASAIADAIEKAARKAGY